MATAMFRLVIEDDRQAAWMAINNTFTMPKNANPQSADHGFLIQLGKSKRLADNLEMDEIEAVKLLGPNGAILHEITSAELQDPSRTYWIDVRQKKRPMKVENLAALKIDRQAVDVENRSLHKFFHPYPGGITLWPTDGLTIRQEKGVKEHHVGYQFELAQPVTVEIFETQTAKKKLVSASSPAKLVIEAKAMGAMRPPPGETENPPQYP